LIENTIYEGIKNDSLIRDIFLGKPNKYLNPLFSFMLFVDSGDVRTEDIKSIFTETANENLPCMTVLLNYAVIIYGKETEKGFGSTKYPWMAQDQDFSWFIMPLQGQSDAGLIEGNHLWMIFITLLDHLNQSFLEPPDFRPYINDMLCGRKSKSIEIKKALHKGK
jgi:hypothetical protein